MMQPGLPASYWKLQAVTHGVRLAEELRDRVDELCSPSMRAGAARAVDLCLADDVSLTANINDNDEAPVVLAASAAGLQLQMKAQSVHARVVVPKFYRQVTAQQRPMWQVATAFGSVLGIHAAGACSFAMRGAPCRFCRVGTPVPTSEAFPMSVEEVIDTVRAAEEESRCAAVYFNTGYLGGEDGGIAFLEPYIRAVKRNFGSPVAVQMHPPKTNAWIDRTYAMGVDAISYGIEAFDANVLQRLCPGRVRFIGRERYHEALAYAATIFPRGTVWSDLVLGIESLESTRAGIDALVRDGVLPVLSTMRAAALAQLPGVAAVDPEDMRPLLTHLYGSVRAAALPLVWVRDLSFAITPYEARSFAVDTMPKPSRTETFLTSSVGDRVASSLSRLRRRLRVQRIDDGAAEAEI